MNNVRISDSEFDFRTTIDGAAKGGAQKRKVKA